MRRQLFAFLTVAVLLTLAVLPKAVQVMPTAEALSSTIVISQVYGGAGCGTAGCSTYKNDYIELFNRGNTPQSVNGWSVQYAAATGTAWQVTNLTNVTLQPGQYLLVAEGAGANGVNNLPTPDVTGTIAMSATAAKVALVNTTTALTGACPTGATIVDLVGYGATASCFETAVAPAPSTTTADVRGANGCTETDNNSTDFTAAAPNPRNTATAAAPCGGGGMPTLNINDVSMNEGNSGTTNFTFTVSLTAPAPMGGVSFTVNTADGTATAPGDYTAIVNGSGSIAEGNSSTNVTVTVNGDVTSEPNETFFVNLTNVTGATAGDVQGLGTITNDDVTVIAIHDIQGNGNASPLANQVVTTTGIVTGLRSNGFFIQTPDAQADADPNTSEGVFVFTSSAPPAAAVIGNSVNVTATVQEFIPTQDTGSPPATELITPTVTLNSSGNTLPAPVTITAADTLVNNINNLEKYEGMRVHVDSLTTVAPTQGTITEASATVSSNGVFYGVITGVARPFREPGIQTPDPVPTPVPSPNNVPVFDGNPERLRVDSDAQPGTTALDVTSNVVITNLTGPLDYAFRTYTILPDAATTPTVGPNIAPRPVPRQTANEFTVGSFNMQRFFDTINDPNVSEPVLTQAAFDKRLNKASLIIRNIMRTPDVIGVTEMENLTTLQAVAQKINTDAQTAGQPNPNYVAYLQEGNDVGGIDVGFLIKSSLSVVDVTQFGLNTTYINPNNGQPELLNDRPPLVARVTVPQTFTGTPVGFTIIINHLRSLSAVDDPVDGNRVRTKRRAQAEYLANLIQARQVADPNEKIITVGDYNAFQFNDGYGDSIGTILGTPAPPDQVTLASPDLVNPNLIDLIDTLPPNEQYSYSFDGNAQALDHELVNQPAYSVFNRLAYGRVNADFPTKYYEDGNRPERLSDHDPAVAYFRLATRNKPFDFDGDNKADLSVFRPSNSTWYILNSGTSTSTATPFGISTDKLTPGDYDGDGKTDIAVFRDGDWYVLQSSNNQVLSRHFGSPGDIATPADYDGDGRTDLSVWRPETGTWYIQRSSDFVMVTQAFGTNGDKPVPGDYDGDGKDNIAVFRPSTGTWYTSTDQATNYGAVQFGVNSDTPIQSDFDGDGKTDVAVFRSSNSTWYILGSTEGFRSVQFGLTTDSPVPADYDGDGKSDVAVFRDGVWYFLLSSDTTRAEAIEATPTARFWGTTGDKPAPAAYVPEQFAPERLQ